MSINLKRFKFIDECLKIFKNCIERTNKGAIFQVSAVEFRCRFANDGLNRGTEANFFVGNQLWKKPEEKKFL